MTDPLEAVDYSFDSQVGSLEERTNRQRRIYAELYKAKDALNSGEEVVEFLAIDLNNRLQSTFPEDDPVKVELQTDLIASYHLVPGVVPRRRTNGENLSNGGVSRMGSEVLVFETDFYSHGSRIIKSKEGLWVAENGRTKFNTWRITYLLEQDLTPIKKVAAIPRSAVVYSRGEVLK